jgi:superfamily II DNA/RNA helicase
MSGRPRCLILVPTRDLAKQVLSCIKNLSHSSKISSGGVLGGEDYARQKKMLDGKTDIIVASPGRLLQHKIQKHVFFGHVTHVIIDEVDTMLTQGFGADISSLLQSVVLHCNKTDASNLRIMAFNSDADADGEGQGPGEERVLRGIPMADSPIHRVQVVMASASITKPVKALLGEMEGFNIKFKDQVNPSTRKRSSVSSSAATAGIDKDSEEDSGEDRISMKIVEVDGLHKALPNVKHDMELLKGREKFEVLDEVLQLNRDRYRRTMVFCNTIDSCRAVGYHVEESHGHDISADAFASYHGDLKSGARDKSLLDFREGRCQYLICTDIAARGLDIPNVDHVLMFDFPLNPIDYLHRSGRTGRAGRSGNVTALVSKRDFVLAKAIENAIAKDMPLDSLTSSKRDYLSSGKLAAVVGLKPSAGGRKAMENRSVSALARGVRSVKKTGTKPKREIKKTAGPRAAVFKTSTSSPQGQGQGQAAAPVFKRNSEARPEKREKIRRTHNFGFNSKKSEAKSGKNSSSKGSGKGKDSKKETKKKVKRPSSGSSDYWDKVNAVKK